MTQQNAPFRTVMRGYDPIEVDRALADAQKALEQARAEAGSETVAVTKLKSQLAQLEEQANSYRARVAVLEQEQKETVAPTFADLGARIGKMLKLAEDEAAEMRAEATVEAERLIAQAEVDAEQCRSEADRHATEVREVAETESARLLEAARQQADEILDYADREATTRREEAEAVYEHQRARAAAAAADFEKTLAERRDKAAEEFSVQMQAGDHAIAMALERRAALESEADRTLAEAKAQAESHLKAARKEAAEQLEAARLASERIRRESERELQAATARRDAITAQLTNVRQMLATLGGASIVNTLIEEEPAAPAPAPAPVQEAAPEPAPAEEDSPGALVEGDVEDLEYEQEEAEPAVRVKADQESLA